jgi:hypothetical protein
MSQGAIEILVSSLGSDRPDAWYVIYFVPYERSGSPIRIRQVIGLDALKEFLLELRIPQGKTDEILGNLSRFKSASIPRVTLSDEQVESFGRAL